MSQGQLAIKQIEAPQAARLKSPAQARAMLSHGIEEQIAELRRLNDSKRIVELAIFHALWLCGATVALIGYTLSAGALRYLVCASGIFLAAVGLNAFVLFLHEGMHRTLFTSPFLNRWVSVALGGATLISFTAYQVMHLRHHKYLGDPRDPDDYRNYTQNPVLLWMMHYLRLLLGAFLYIMLIPFTAYRYGSPADRRNIVIEYLLMVTVYMGVISTVPQTILIYGWLLPLVIVGYMTNIRGFSQHSITDTDDPFLASRSIDTHPIVAFCMLNENYHLEHHLFPEVPSYNLRQLHTLVWSRLPYVVTGSSYLGFLGRFLHATLTMDDSPIGLTKPVRHKLEA